MKLGNYPTPRAPEDFDILKEQIKNPSDTLTLDSLRKKKKLSNLSEEDEKTIRDIIERNNLNELDYYRMRHFVNAWFVDNVGSILIAIERKKK